MGLVSVQGSTLLPVTQGSALNGTYALKQLHFHAGSEHTFDGVQRPLEVHLVHKAEAGTTGIVVIGISFIEGAEENSMLAPIVEGLGHLTQRWPCVQDIRRWACETHLARRGGCP